jgi:SAM-dependent methyltransferase
MSKTLWREMLYKELAALELNGEILDLGGSRKSSYHELLKGNHKIHVANMDEDQGAELNFDLEQKFPLEDLMFDNLMCINVLEHIFDYQNVLSESHRILRQDGALVLAVPFLIQVHPSPRDHWRFSKETLYKIFEQAGFKDVEIQTIGTGVFGATYQLKHNLYRTSLIQTTFKWSAKALDKVLSLIKKDSVFSKKYYPLGYLVVAKK